MKANYLVSRLHDTLAPLGHGYQSSADPGEQGAADPRGTISDLEGQILRALAWGRKVLEIGTGLGYSTSYIVEGAIEVHTHDSDPWVWRNVYPELLDPRITTHTHRMTIKGRFDFAFIDGNHETVSVSQDIDFCARLTSMIVLHDWTHIPDVSRAAADKAGTICEIDTQMGLGILMLK